MAKGKQNQGQQGGGGNNTPNKREDSIAEVFAAKATGFFSQLLGDGVVRGLGLKDTIKRIGGENVFVMIDRVGTALEVVLGGDVREQEMLRGFFKGAGDALKDVKDPGEASAKLDAFFAGPAAKALLDKKDMLGKQPLMSFADALAAMSEGDDKKEIRTLIKGLSDADLASVMTRQATPAQLHGLAQIAEANSTISPAKLLLTLPEPPKKGMDKATADAKKLVEAVQKLLDMLESESSGKTPEQLQAEILLLQRQRQGMALLREGLRPQPRSVMWPMVAFTVVLALVLWFVVSKLGS